MLKILTIASMSLALATGAALAQTQTDGEATGAIGQNSSNVWTDADMAMFEANPDIYSTFFMDDTWTEMRAEEEIATNWTTLTPEQQAAVRADCEDLNADASRYSQGTIAFCASIGAL